MDDPQKTNVTKDDSQSVDEATMTTPPNDGVDGFMRGLFDVEGKPKEDKSTSELKKTEKTVPVEKREKVDKVSKTVKSNDQEKPEGETKPETEEDKSSEEVDKGTEEKPDEKTTEETKEESKPSLDERVETLAKELNLVESEVKEEKPVEKTPVETKHKDEATPKPDELSDEIEGPSGKKYSMKQAVTDYGEEVMDIISGIAVKAAAKMMKDIISQKAPEVTAPTEIAEIRQELASVRDSLWFNAVSDAVYDETNQDINVSKISQTKEFASWLADQKKIYRDLANRGEVQSATLVMLKWLESQKETQNKEVNKKKEVMKERTDNIHANTTHSRGSDGRFASGGSEDAQMTGFNRALKETGQLK